LFPQHPSGLMAAVVDPFMTKSGTVAVADKGG
jgi:hypothetical protein